MSEVKQWDGEERRERTAGEAEVALRIAARAAKHGLTVDQIFDLNPRESHLRPEDLDNTVLRRKVVALLKEASLDYPEMGQVVGRFVDEQYEGTMNTLSTFNLYDSENLQEGDVVSPTLEEAKEILMNQVTPEQLEIIKGMEKPTLQLIPICSMNRYIEALNSHKPMPDQIKTFVSDWHKAALERSDARDGVVGNNSIIGWRIAVTEGSKEPKLLEGDDVRKMLGERSTWFKREYGEKGVTGVDLKRVLTLMMESLETGAPISDVLKVDGTWTFVNEEGEYDGLVSGVDWGAYDHRVDLDGNPAGFSDDGARFRASVMVDVPQS